MIFDTTGEAIRQGLVKSELRMNLLRICSRAPRTIHDLIHAPDYPGIEVNLFSLQSEINVAVELGECKNRGLLIQVGRVPDPVVPGGTTELVRTTLLAFLLSPELARKEPAAYRLYIEAWLEAADLPGEAKEGWKELLVVYPELATKAFFSRSGPKLDDPYFQGDPRRVFGCHHIRDLPTVPHPFSSRDLRWVVKRPPLMGGFPLVLRGSLVGRLAWLKWKAVRSRPSPETSLEVEPLSGPELFPDRLRPVPWGPAHPSSSTSRRSYSIPPKRHRASRQEAASSGETGSGMS